MALGIGKSPEDADSLIRSIYSTLESENLMASFGHAEYNPGDNFENICKQADTRMYDDKQSYTHRDSLDNRN